MLLYRQVNGINKEEDQEWNRWIFGNSVNSINRGLQAAAIYRSIWRKFHASTKRLHCQAAA